MKRIFIFIYILMSSHTWADNEKVAKPRFWKGENLLTEIQSFLAEEHIAGCKQHYSEFYKILSQYIAGREILVCDNEVAVLGNSYLKDQRGAYYEGISIYKGDMTESWIKKASVANIGKKLLDYFQREYGVRCNPKSKRIAPYMSSFECLGTRPGETTTKWDLDYTDMELYPRQRKDGKTNYDLSFRINLR